MSKLSELTELADLLELGWRLYAGKATETPPDKYIALEELVAELRKVLISSDDTTPDYPGTKIIGTTDVVTLTVVNPSGNEQLQITLPTTIVGNRFFDGQAHGGKYIKTWSASATFSADDGNNQYMEVTASTTIEIADEEPGVFIIDLEINSGLNPTITLGTSLGVPYDNTPDIINSDGDINTITN